MAAGAGAAEAAAKAADGGAAAAIVGATATAVVATIAEAATTAATAVSGAAKSAAAAYVGAAEAVAAVGATVRPELGLPSPELEPEPESEPVPVSVTMIPSARGPQRQTESRPPHAALPSSSPEPRPMPLPQLSPFKSPWTITIYKKLEEAQQYETSSSWSTLSIYRIPKSLRKVDEIAYTPQIVSLGPYHPELRCHGDMELHKWRALHHVLTRNHHDVSRYLDAARSLQDRAHDCYEAPLSLPAENFVESLVLDAIFALELLRGMAKEGFLKLGYNPDDPVFAVRRTILSLQRDMIMLENQLPLFVLDCIFALQPNWDSSGPISVAHLARLFFNRLLPIKLPPSVVNGDADSSGALHFLDVIRQRILGPNSQSAYRFRCQSQARPVTDNRSQQLIRCTTELRNVGVKFRPLKDGGILDISFKDGVLQIPRLLIVDGTKSLFLNLIAFEQCHLKCDNHITSYVIFMDNLINSEKDVGYLHKKGIIENWLGNDGMVADLFNQLALEVFFNVDDCYLSELSKQVNTYSKRRWNAWRTNFIHKHFSNPWTFISLVAAALLLLLTLAQTFYAVYGYYKHN